MNTTDVQGTLREMWETRPARPRRDRQVAGVAAGVARRYDIDPVLVRVGFVVAAFLGVGAGLYIAGWILLPDEPVDPAAPQDTKSPRALMLVALAIAAIVSIGSLFNGTADVILPLLAIAGILYLLHRSRGSRGVAGGGEAQTTVIPGAPTAAQAASSGPSMVKEPHVDEPVQPVPPAWDPLGAAPFAWDLPEPSPASQAPVPVTRKLPVTSVTLGFALLAGGVTAVVLLLAGAFNPANLPLMLGVPLAVIGMGLVVGSFVRSGRGLIPFALIIGALTWASLSAPLERWQEGYSELVIEPTTVAQLQPVYERPFGEVVLDLRNLDLTVPAGGDAAPVPTTVSLGAGEITVRLPENADVSVKAEAGLGNVEFGGQSQTGTGSQLDIKEDLGADGVKSGRMLQLVLETGAGNVEVHRG
ncbi:PspC domain-containing protein [Pseudonocardia sp. TRM90224]|uniref:PspC domain-containing protein n=1 Tax=Pseudonocardia sp. TRM90224 TaxID=2812678 RepID=UPI001E2CC4AA|nr:PspC domain-containing protein [Pseudonocardia sp. TRM90224]